MPRVPRGNRIMPANAPNTDPWRARPSRSRLCAWSFLFDECRSNCSAAADRGYSKRGRCGAGSKRAVLTQPMAPTGPTCMGQGGHQCGPIVQSRTKQNLSRTSAERKNGLPNTRTATADPASNFSHTPAHLSQARKQGKASNKFKGRTRPAP